MTAEELHDARVLALLPERLRRLRGPVFVMSARLPRRREIGVREIDAIELMTEEPRGDAA